MVRATTTGNKYIPRKLPQVKEKGYFVIIDYSYLFIKSSSPMGRLCRLCFFSDLHTRTLHLQKSDGKTFPKAQE